jgi:hypothetical protein
MLCKTYGVFYMREINKQGSTITMDIAEFGIRELSIEETSAVSGSLTSSAWPWGVVFPPKPLVEKFPDIIFSSSSNFF